MRRHSPSRAFTLVALVATVACGGGDDDASPDAAATYAASFTIGDTTRSFDPNQCSLGSLGTVYQLMCARAGGTPQLNIVLQAPAAIGTYDQSTPDLTISVVDPGLGVQLLCGTCTVVVTGTAAPGQGRWQGTFEVAGIDTTATGTFDVDVDVP